MTDTTNERECWPRCAHGIAVGVLLAVGLALRVYGAWITRFITDPDSSVVALMAAHMAAGTEFPVFFYGQPYMGSLEPAFSALLCRLFGTSGFMVALGTALVGAAILPVIYAWGRSTGGPRAGLVALALCVIGPNAYLMFQWNPRGGYMATILLGALVMWFGGRMANALWRRTPVPLWHFALLGLLAGLGWWTNPLIASALVATAIVLAVGTRGRLPLVGLLVALAAFGVGSAPFWIWNARHAWESFTYFDRAGGMHWRSGMKLLVDHYHRMLHLAGMPPAWRTAAFALPLILGGCGLLVAIARLAPRREGFKAHRATILIFLLLSAFFYVNSSYARLNTARYLLPWVPAVAVLAGLALSRWRSAAGATLAGVAVAAVIATQIHSLRPLPTIGAATSVKTASVSRFSSVIASNGIDAVYAPFMHYALNFHTRERVPVTALFQERYLPIARAVESASAIACYDLGGKVANFLNETRGSGACVNLNNHPLQFNFKPPAGSWMRIPTSDWAAVSTSDGASPLEMLTDANADTIWRVSLDTPERPWLEVRFAAPVTLRGVRMRATKSSCYPPGMGISMLPPDSDSWQVLLPDQKTAPFCWSGPRPYHEGLHYREEFRFADVKVRGLRFVSFTGERSAPEDWAISELECFGPTADPATSEEAALPVLLARLEQSGARRVYSDRWLANRLHAARPDLEVMLDPAAYPDCPLRAEERIRLDPGTMLVVLATEAATTRAVLERHGIALAETAAAPWVLFDVPASGKPVVTGGLRPPLLWVGYAALTGRMCDYARDLLALAESQWRDRADPESVLALLQEAAAADPLVLFCGTELLTEVARALPPARQADLLALKQAIPPMSHPLGIRYDRTFELLGFHVDPGQPRVGEPLSLTYYWRMPADTRKWKWGVFTHFRQGEIRFQDDHHLLRLRAPESGTPGKRLVVIREDRTLTVPGDAPLGRYDLQLGLTAGPMQRARVDNYTPVKRRAAVVAGVFELQPAEGR